MTKTAMSGTDFDRYMCTTYPELFKNRNASPQETLMCWGFSVGPGWHDILSALCDNIQHYTEWNNKNFDKGYTQYKQVPPVTVVQVKEKFGTLRFYYDGGDDKIDGMVRMAESMSAVTCEKCGKPGGSTDGGWIRTLCDEHREEYEGA
jgi:hypothetical protein